MELVIVYLRIHPPASLHLIGGVPFFDHDDVELWLNDTSIDYRQGRVKRFVDEKYLGLEYDGGVVRYYHVSRIYRMNNISRSC
jgi:hypothetical protein